MKNAPAGRPSSTSRVGALRCLFALVIVAIPMFVATPSDAHPLGNFTVNRYAGIEVSRDVVRVTYVVDKAEIPTFQDKVALDAGRDTYVANQIAGVLDGLQLTVDGSPAALVPTDQLLTQPEGQGGLLTTRLALSLEAQAPPSGVLHQATFSDDNDADVLGWREVTVEAGGNATVEGSGLSATSISNELREYPEDLLQTPLDQRRVSFGFDPGTEAVAAEPLDAGDQTISRTNDVFVDLVDGDLKPLAIISAFATAAVIGAVHALGPGHGKGVMAAYLVGTKGRPRDAVALGVIVALMHTGSVLVIGGVLFAVGAHVDIAGLYPILTIASGAAVIVFGSTLVYQRYRRMVLHKRAHSHAHEHELAHDWHHEHLHHHGPGGHTHDLPEDVAPLTKRGLLIIATSGGIIPAPSAIIVLLASLALGRLAFGLSLIAVFSIGLAATLSAVGLALVYGRDRFSRHKGSAHILKWLPIASAVALVLLGVVLTVRGLIEL